MAGVGVGVGGVGVVCVGWYVLALEATSPGWEASPMRKPRRGKLAVVDGRAAMGTVGVW